MSMSGSHRGQIAHITSSRSITSMSSSTGVRPARPLGDRAGSLGLVSRDVTVTSALRTEEDAIEFDLTWEDILDQDDFT
jgi:hypothetical protein